MKEQKDPGEEILNGKGKKFELSFKHLAYIIAIFIFLGILYSWIFPSPWTVNPVCENWSPLNNESKTVADNCKIRLTADDCTKVPNDYSADVRSCNCENETFNIMCLDWRGVNSYDREKFNEIYNTSTIITG